EPARHDLPQSAGELGGARRQAPDARLSVTDQARRKTKADNEQEAAEGNLQPTLRKRVSQACAIRSGETRDGSHQRKADQRYEAEREGRNERLLGKAGEAETDRATDGDGHAEPRRSRDRLVDRFVVKRQDHVGYRAAADAHQRGGKPDADAIGRHADWPWQIV